MKIRGVAYIQGGASGNNNDTPEFIENTVKIQPPVELTVEFAGPPIGSVEKLVWEDGKLIAECEVSDAAIEQLVGRPKLACSFSVDRYEMGKHRNLLAGGRLDRLAVVIENSCREGPPYEVMP